MGITFILIKMDIFFIYFELVVYFIMNIASLLIHNHLGENAKYMQRYI